MSASEQQQDTAAPLDRAEAFRLVRRLLSENVRRYRRAYVLAFLCMGLVAATTAASAAIMRNIINEIFADKNLSAVMIIAGVVTLIYLVKGAASFFQQIILTRIGNDIVATLQKRMYDHMLAHGLDFYQRNPLGELTTRITHNAQAARNVIDLVVLSLGRDLFTLIGLVIVMVAQNPKLSLISLALAPPAILGIGRLVRKAKKVARQEFFSSAEVTAAVQETVLGAEVIRAYGLEGRMRNRAYRAVDAVRDRLNELAALRAWTSPLMETLGGLAIAGVILYAGYSVIEQGEDPGAFFAFLTALLLAYEPAKRLARLNVGIQQGLKGVQLMYALLDDAPRLKDAPEAGALPEAPASVRLEDVSFQYGAAPVLHNVTLEAEAGKITALVGPSGAGKSTIFTLIERFYDPTGGRVLVKGADIRDVSMAALRGSIAYVGQNTFLFSGSIRENIRMGRDSASDAEVEAAAEAANAHDFITALPGGYDAPVGDGGGRLSGGQRQRIAIARALLRDAPILLLDEATSALDAESESVIQKALQRLMVGRTVIVIAHRLSTIRSADCIHVLEAGRVVQSGTHHDLVRQDGLYAHLHRLQFNTD